MIDVHRAYMYKIITALYAYVGRAQGNASGHIHEHSIIFIAEKGGVKCGIN